MTTQTTPAAAPAPAAAPTTQAPASGTPAPAAQTQPAPAAQPTTPETPPAAAPAEQAKAAADLVLKLPDGAKFDEKVLGEFKAIMGDQKLTPQERAQRLVDLQFSQAAARDKAADEMVQKQRLADLDALKADKEFGGAKFDQTRAQAASALKQFFGERVSTLFQALGVDNDADLVKGLARIRQAIAEDTIAGTVTPGSKPRTEEDRLRQMMPTSYDQIQKGRRTA